MENISKTCLEHILLAGLLYCYFKAGKTFPLLVYFLNSWIYSKSKYIF